jgi:metal-responsive CopG/Arc/MetJ family transcriptional regulator
VNLKAILVNFPEADLERLDKLVPRFYPNRNEAIRMAVHDFLAKEGVKQK